MVSVTERVKATPHQPEEYEFKPCRMKTVISKWKKVKYKVIYKGKNKLI